MPNWCYNRMNIDSTTEGGRILAEAFRPKYEDERGNPYANPLTDLYPTPPELDITAGFGNQDQELLAQYDANMEKFGFKHWYDWRVAKWDAQVMDFNDDNPKDVYLQFETAWSPPTAFLEWFCKQHPDTVFECEYDEEGMFFEGKTTYDPVNGFHDECWEPEDQSEEFEDEEDEE